jgi:hypothetical protein
MKIYISSKIRNQKRIRKDVAGAVVVVVVGEKIDFVAALCRNRLPTDCPYSNPEINIKIFY